MRVITGKGLHSVGPPVLRVEVERLLVSLRGAVVASFAVEPGGGSFRIELRRPSDTRPAPLPATGGPATEALSGADTLLRRRAEEILWELGISPTPPLIEAEVRRLRRLAEGGA